MNCGKTPPPGDLSCDSLKGESRKISIYNAKPARKYSRPRKEKEGTLVLRHLWGPILERSIGMKIPCILSGEVRGNCSGHYQRAAMRESEQERIKRYAVVGPGCIAHLRSKISSFGWRKGKGLASRDRRVPNRAVPRQSSRERKSGPEGRSNVSSQ